jgi:hypothetical protein
MYTKEFCTQIPCPYDPIADADVFCYGAWQFPLWICPYFVTVFGSFLIWYSDRRYFLPLRSCTVR